MSFRNRTLCRLRTGAGRSWLVLALVVALTASVAGAQVAAAPQLVGVIASRTGAGAAAGVPQWLLASERATQLRGSGGIFGVDVSFELRDDNSVPASARRHAEELVDLGALVIVCCTTPLATRDVAQVAEAAGVTLLAPTTFEDAAPYPYWAFALAADDTDSVAAIVADAYREPRHSLALMALEGPLGDAAEADLRAHLAVIGAAVPHVERYTPGTTELRPEALLVAASQPGGVVVWGLYDDLLVAYEALRRRGYEGTVYGRSALLAPGHSPLPWARLINLRLAVAPAVAPLASAPSSADPRTPSHGTWGAAGACAAAVHLDSQRLARVPGAATNAVATAPFLAALDLIELGLEQVIALQIPSSEPAVLRQALRDALVGRPALCTGAGLIDLRDGSPNAVDPAGLAIAVVT
ncbi:MAG: ABC transporter substrate-binding protein, partial [Trueperaceae bacterium]